MANLAVRQPFLLLITHGRKSRGGGRRGHNLPPPHPTVVAPPQKNPDFLPRGLFPPPFQHRGIRSLWPRGGQGCYISMSISASEKEEWAGSEPEQSGSSEPSGLQEEFMRVLSKAVQELELTWNPPEEPVRSKLDSWYFRSTRKADSRTSVPFFPDVHEQLVKTWSAPQSARVHSNTQAMFSHVDGAEAHGYVSSPPRRGNRCCTPVSCNSEDPRLGHRPSLEAVQNHRPPR